MSQNKVLQLSLAALAVGAASAYESVSFTQKNTKCTSFGFDYGVKFDNGCEVVNDMNMKDIPFAAGDDSCLGETPGTVSIGCDGEGVVATITADIKFDVIVKGGTDGGTLYTGVDASTPTALTNGGSKRQAISHIEFCFNCGEGPAPAAAETTPAAPAPAETTPEAPAPAETTPAEEPAPAPAADEPAPAPADEPAPAPADEPKTTGKPGGKAPESCSADDLIPKGWEDMEWLPAGPRCCTGFYGDDGKKVASCDTSSCPNNFGMKNLLCHNYGTPQFPAVTNPNKKAGSAICPYIESDKAICDVSYYNDINDVSCRNNDPQNAGKVHCLGKVKCQSTGVEFPARKNLASYGTDAEGLSGIVNLDSMCNEAAEAAGLGAGTDCFYMGNSDNFKVCGDDGVEDGEPIPGSAEPSDCLIGMDEKSGGVCFDLTMAGDASAPVGGSACVKVDAAGNLEVTLSSASDSVCIHEALMSLDSDGATGEYGPSASGDCVSSVTLTSTPAGTCANADSYEMALLADLITADGSTYSLKGSAGGHAVMLAVDCGCTGSEKPKQPSGPEEPKPVPGGASGDPHFKTWTGDKYDYHGECDLVLVDNPTFMDGLGLKIHIRTTRVKYFSYIENVAVQIGDDVLEFDNDVENFYINGVHAAENLKHHKTMLDRFIVRRDPKALSIRLHDEGRHDHYVAKIDLHTRKNGFPAVIVDGGNTDIFKGSLGLLGEWESGRRLARDGVTEMNGEDATDFALEWQVRDTEPMLFREARFPQFPTICTPPAERVANRLGQSNFQKEAEAACAHWKDDMDDCIFDVIATRDILVAEEGHIAHLA